MPVIGTKQKPHFSLLSRKDRKDGLPICPGLAQASFPPDSDKESGPDVVCQTSVFLVTAWDPPDAICKKSADFLSVIPLCSLY